ncbi:MAG: PD-(D/E)XK nuclease family transposase [Bacteroidales bacterium]|nr:PD-(D/E)XK nuclease family transposase [Bacteroidales bacterium]
MKTVYRLYEEKTHTLLTDKLTFIFIELNKFKKGLAEGRAEGLKEKSIEIARKLLAAGYPKDEVLELTGVKAEEL